MKKFDVTVVGAGPAGSTAAYYLAKTGLKTLIVDKALFPREKICGGGLTKRAKDLLPFEIESVIQRKISKVVFREEKSGIEISIEREEPFLFMVTRGEFDFFLLEKALEAGAEFLPKTEIESFESGVLKSNNWSIRSREVVAADGATGFFAKRTKNYFLKIPALEVEVPLSTVNTNVVTRFDFGFPNNGYSWVFPKRDFLTIGTAAVGKERRINLYKTLQNYLHFLGMKSELRNEQGYFIPILKGKPIPCFENVLLTGDALGVADPLTLEGITFAIKTGKLAAQTIIGSFERNKRICKEYSQKIAEEIYKELKYARFVSNLIYNHELLRAFLMKNYGENLANKMVEVITGTTHYSKEFRKFSNFVKLIKYFLVK